MQFTFQLLSALYYFLILFINRVESWSPISRKPISKNIFRQLPKIAGVLVSLGTLTYTDARLRQNHHQIGYVSAKEDNVYTKSVFNGEYNDPNHPGCLRKIKVKGKEVTIIGSDDIDGSTQWIIKANEDYPGTIFVDFSPKGGPKNLLGVFDEKDNGIKWPDGNLWTKLK